MSHGAGILKRIAEAADGLRGHGPHWIQVNNKKLREIKVSKKKPKDKPGFTVLEVKTEEHDHLRGFNSKIKHVKIVYEDETIPDVTYVTKPNGDTTRKDWIDALFFSPSAIDKFVVPYLASVYDAHTAVKLHEEFVDGLKNGTITAVPHRPPTVFE